VRFYDFKPHEVIAAADDDGMLPLDIDPKLAWALKYRAHFPIDVNRAPRETLLRVPGLGVRAVDALIRARRMRSLRLEDVGRLTRGVKKLLPFIVAADWRPVLLADRANLDALVRAKPEQQMELFG
jgi:predicted DNA-binding helix-hairpin-helix protein